MEIKHSIIIILLVCSAHMLSAQYMDSEIVVIHSDPQIEQLLDLHIDYNKKFPSIDGYRIQLLMQAGNTALEEANKMKYGFEEKYPQIKTYITFKEPYYRLRIGDYRSRLEAMEFLEILKRSYPQAWVIKDKITFPDLINYQ